MKALSTTKQKNNLMKLKNKMEFYKKAMNHSNNSTKIPKKSILPDTEE